MRARGWRKIATALWGWPQDPQVYGRLELDATPVLRAIDVLERRSGERVTVTHLVVRAVGLALAESPTVNTRRVGGRFVPREGADVFVIVSTGEGADLSGVKVRHADRRSAVEIAREVNARAEETRAGGAAIEGGKRLLESLPAPVLRLALRGLAWLTIDRGVDLGRLGMPREAFGSAMVSSVGMFGVSEGWAPLSLIYRVPVLVLVGEIERRPWAVGDAVEVRPVLTVTATFDHRWVDGHGISRLVHTFRRYMDDPLAAEEASESAEPADAVDARELRRPPDAS